MNAATLGRSLPSSALRRWRALRPRARWGFALLMALAAGSWATYRSLADPWPARSVLRTPMDTWPLAFSPDGRKFLTSGDEGITPWDVATGRKGEPWPIGGGEWAFAGVYSPDGRTFAGAVAARPGPVRIVLLDAATGRARATIPSSSTSVYDLAFADDGREVRAFLGDVPQLKEVATFDASTGEPKSSRPLRPPTAGCSVRISPDGKLMAYAPFGGCAVQFWDLDADRPLPAQAGLASALSVHGLGFSPDGRTLAVGRQDGTVALWDVPARRPIRTMPAHQGGHVSQGITFAPDGRTLASRGEFLRPTSTLGHLRRGIAQGLLGLDGPEGEVIILDVATGRRVGRAGHAIHPYFSPDGRTLATREEDLTVRLRDLPQPAR